MKIILQAFGGKMRSGIMDVPENSTPIWDMVLLKPHTLVSDFSGNKIADRLPMQTLCRFEWTGKRDFDSRARLYELIDIVKQ